MDGPDYFKLFAEMKCLNGETNAAEIVKHLRFTKDEGTYQTYLRHYLPMLSKDHFDQFIGDVTDEKLKEELQKRFPDTEEEVEKKKLGRPKKVVDPITPVL